MSALSFGATCRRTRAPSSGVTPPGGRPGAIQTMTEIDNSSATASSRGGVGSCVKRTRPTATKVNTIRRARGTSLRVKGEVEMASGSGPLAVATLRPEHGGRRVLANVVGGSRSGRGDAREDGRAAGTGLRKESPAAVRAAIRAKKRGTGAKRRWTKPRRGERSESNARGAKGGRKAKGGEP